MLAAAATATCASGEAMGALSLALVAQVDKH